MTAPVITLLDVEITLFCESEAMHNPSGLLPYRIKSNFISSGEVISDLPMRRVACRKFVWQAGEDRSAVYAVLSGSVITFTMTKDGQRIIFELGLPGDWIGLDFSSQHKNFGLAAVDTIVRPIPLAGLKRNAQLYPLLVDHVMRRAAVVQNRLVILSRRTAIERVAGLVMAMVKPGEDEMTFPLRRSDVADYLCLSTESVSRAITAMKQQKILRQLSLYRFRIVDRAKLIRLFSTDH